MYKKNTNIASWYFLAPPHLSLWFYECLHSSLHSRDNKGKTCFYNLFRKLLNNLARSLALSAMHYLQCIWMTYHTPATSKFNYILTNASTMPPYNVRFDVSFVASSFCNFSILASTAWIPLLVYLLPQTQMAVQLPWTTQAFAIYCRSLQGNTQNFECWLHFITFRPYNAHCNACLPTSNVTCDSPRDRAISCLFTLYRPSVELISILYNNIFVIPS